ncbi:MAG: hypothetical protein IJJ13_10480 [Lachnospiraceae bacterium]|nr:hypothetical protein [Lachnospiraceae bacterium]
MFNPADLLKLGAESFVTQPAYIKIKDCRSMTEDEFKAYNAELAKGGGSPLGLDIPGGDKLNNVVNNLKDKAQDAAKNAVSSVVGGGALGALGGLIGGKLGIGGARNDKYDKVFKVQFNPSSLQISSQGGGEIVQKTSYANGKKNSAGSIEMSVTMPHVEMSVQLIFDSLTDNYKAFASDLANFSTTNLINEGLNLVDNLVGEKLLGSSSGIGVQGAVEGFVAAMRNKYTRQVCFEWGDLYYQGEFKSVNATYTMFDSVGRPVRAKVNMSIYLQDESVSNGELGHWESAYDEVFGNGSVNLGGGTAMNVAKSVLNF